MEFEHLNQPDFDRERDGSIVGILNRKDTAKALPSLTTLCRQAYNEGYKQALRDWSIWKDGVQHIGCMQHDIKEIIEDVDRIDHED